MRWYREIPCYDPQMMAKESIEAVNFLEDKMNQPNKPTYCRLPYGIRQFLKNHLLMF